MNYKNVFMGVFAILAATLIFDLPVVGATQINIYYDVGGGTYIKQDDVTIEPENLIDKTVSVQSIGASWINVKVIINITNGGMGDLESVHIYKCKDLSPSDCVETETPDMYSIVNNDLDLEMLWGDVSQIIISCSSNPGSCLEIANLFFLFKVNDNGKTVWVGIWNKIERRTYDFASPYLFEYSLDEIDLYAQAGFAVPVKEFIQTYLTIPFNPAWVSAAIFKGADSLYELSIASSGLQQSSPNFYTQDHTNDTVHSITRDYSFIFSEASQDIFNPTTLRLNPSFFCGQYGCETELGETSANCCYDCPCSEGYYCDGGTEGICKLESLISLSLYEPPNTTITNCNEQHVINVTAKVDYAPSDTDLTRSEYKLNETVYSTQCEEILSNVYRCPITIPPIPGCQEGEYAIGPNYLNFTISYTDGPNAKSKDLVLQFPDITVGSFTCGQDGCESELGENSNNCCYDCGCPNGYCDIASGAQPNTGTCRQDITVNNLQITANPTHFYTHNNISGDRVDIVLQITDAPLSMEITSSSCEMDCLNNCSVSCGVSCSEISSSDPNIFNASCLLTFLISDYNKTIDYSLFPTMNISVIYTNGSFGDVNKTFSKLFSTISVGSSWCGDDVCAPDENQLNCCYDCGCPEGYYCDTANSAAPTVGDSCKSEDGIRLVVDGVEVTTFDYSDMSHYTVLMAHVENAPSSLNGSTSCMFGDGSSLYCNMVCERFGTDPSSHILQCNLSIPVIDYKTSPFYNPSTRQIVIGPNTMNYSVTFNNGSGLISKELSDDFSNIVINVKPRCGTGAGYLGFEAERCMPYNRTLACETDLGESSATCCCDCPCPSGQYCDINANGGRGRCISIAEIHLVTDEFDPQPLECEIDQTRNFCVFYEQMDIDLHIEPTANYSFVSASYEMDGEKRELWSCIPGSDNSPWNKYNCSIVIAPIESETDIYEGTITKDIELSVEIESTGLLHTTVTDTGNFQIKKVEGKALETLEEQLETFEADKRKWNTIKNVIIAVLVILALWCLCTCLPLCYGEPCCPWPSCGDCWGIYSCIVAVILPFLISVINKINEIENQIMALNAAQNPEELYVAEQGTATLVLGIIAAIAGIVCAFYIGGGGFGKKDVSTNSSSTYSKMFSLGSQALNTFSLSPFSGPECYTSFDCVDKHGYGWYCCDFKCYPVPCDQASQYGNGNNGWGWNGDGNNGGYNGNGDKKKTCGELEKEKKVKPACHCCNDDGYDTGASCSGNKKPGDKCGLGNTRGKCKEGMCKHS